MDIESNILFPLLSSISFTFIAIVCLITYEVNKLYKAIYKKNLPRNGKSITSLIVGIIVSILYITKLDMPIDSILLSFLVCTFGYDLILKPLFKGIKKRFIGSKSE